MVDVWVRDHENLEVSTSSLTGLTEIRLHRHDADVVLSFSEHHARYLLEDLLKLLPVAEQYALIEQVQHG